MSSKKHVQVMPLPSDTARSSAINDLSPGPVSEELDALEHLKNEWKRDPDRATDFGGTRGRKVLIFDLDEFDIYGSSGSRREHEFVSLHLQSPELKDVSLNGFLFYGAAHIRIESAPVLSYSIEGYDDEEDGPVTIFVQTQQASKDRHYDIWYRLTDRPTSAYRRFHDPFVWIATFGKHFLDFLGSDSALRLGLRDFESFFWRWLQKRFKDGAHFRAWHKEFGKTDFRGQVVVHLGYLWSQAYNLSNWKMLDRHPVWADCMLGDRLSIPKQPMTCTKTITTPFVFECFRHMYFGYFLKKKSPTKSVLEELENRKRLLGFSRDLSPQPNMSQAPIGARPHKHQTFKVGDVISVPPDNTEHQDWLAYVQRTEALANGTQRLYVLWLYRPSDTMIKKASYPIMKECFLSDNCNCGKADTALLSTEVTRIYSVDWWPKDLNTTCDVLVRQKYITRDNTFVALKRSDFNCGCHRSPVNERYQRGDTLYIKTRSGRPVGPSRLEPVVICKVNDEHTVTVRRLRRLKRDCLHVSGNTRQRGIAENELVWTSEYEQVKTESLNRKCSIRYFPKDEVLTGRIPVPYDRRGNGDCWFFTSRLTKTKGLDMRLEFLADAPTSFRQGLDLGATPPFKKLRGLSIFSGCGNFDRGLEEGGAVEFQTAVDFSPEAIHTQKANARNPEKLSLYCGSVDDFLNSVLNGERQKPLAQIGEVQLIAGGSPCPGFSVLQTDPFGERSCRNASHITTICSYADIFRPQYGIFENVVNMASTRKGYEEQNVLSHVVACFVAMGYQVQFAIVDSWSYGSAQRRERLFILIAAPGVEPIVRPPHTHSHPETVKGRSLGKQLDGLSFGDREQHDTPFLFTTAGDATSDLPDIGAGTPQTCIPFPDHRMSAPMSLKDRVICRSIPTLPPGQGYAEALKLDLIPKGVQRTMAEVGKAFRRIKKDGLFPTITTTMCVQNSRASGILHCEQPRCITLQEARRAQGILDHEVVIGSPGQQLQQMGNAVDRYPTLAYGLALRQAWEKTNAAGRQRSFTPPILASTSGIKQASSIILPKATRAPPVVVETLKGWLVPETQAVPSSLGPVTTSKDRHRSSNGGSTTSRGLPNGSQATKESPASTTRPVAPSAGYPPAYVDSRNPRPQTSTTSPNVNHISTNGAKAPKSSLLTRMSWIFDNAKRKDAVPLLQSSVPSPSPPISLPVHAKRPRENEELLESRKKAKQTTTVVVDLTSTSKNNDPTLVQDEIYVCEDRTSHSSEIIRAIDGKGRSSFTEQKGIPQRRRTINGDDPSTNGKDPSSFTEPRTANRHGPSHSHRQREDTVSTERSNSTARSDARRTRYSGLPVEFQPTNWNNLAEKTVRK